MVVHLDDLPVFKVKSISMVGNEANLIGTFNHLKSVRNGRSWLYSGNAESLIGDLMDLDAVNRNAIFNAPFWSPKSPIQIGSSVPWVDGYWQAYHVTMIIDPQAKWERIAFVPSDAQHYTFQHNNLMYRGWQKLGGKLSEGHIPTHIEKNGWDHEHCQLCNGHIGRGGQTHGYLNDQDQWLCESCYERYAKSHNLEFLLES